MSKVSISLKITDFDLEIDELSVMLNLTPTDFYLKDQKYNLKTECGMVEKSYPNSFWEYRLKFNTDVWAQTLIDKFIDEIISSRKDILKDLSQKYYLEFFVTIHYFNNANPGFHFDKEKLNLLAEIGFELDIDLYTHSGSG